MKRNIRKILLLFILITALMNALPASGFRNAAAGSGLFTSPVITVSAKRKKGRYVSVKKAYGRLNRYRRVNGVAKIRKSATLERLAKKRAKELVKRYSHTRPNGKDGYRIIPADECGTIDIGYHHYYYRGENIARGQKTWKKVMSAWYHSPSHRSNMLNEYFAKVGIAGYKYKGRIYWVQLFSS